MDITVAASADETGTWELTDLLGRRMGRVSDDGGKFTIEPEGNAEETMKGLRRGPYPSLDEALEAIETLTRGVCRMATGSAP